MFGSANSLTQFWPSAPFCSSLEKLPANPIPAAGTPGLCVRREGGCGPLGQAATAGGLWPPWSGCHGRWASWSGCHRRKSVASEVCQFSCLSAATSVHSARLGTLSSTGHVCRCPPEGRGSIVFQGWYFVAAMEQVSSDHLSCDCWTWGWMAKSQINTLVSILTLGLNFWKLQLWILAMTLPSLTSPAPNMPTWKRRCLAGLRVLGCEERAWHV